jgi:hypothetical protein
VRVRLAPSGDLNGPDGVGVIEERVTDCEGHRSTLLEDNSV